MKKYFNDKVETATDVAILEAERILNKVNKEIMHIKLKEASKMLFILCVEHYQLKAFSVNEMNKESVRMTGEIAVSDEDEALLYISHFTAFAYAIYSMNTGEDFDLNTTAPRDLPRDVFEKISKISELFSDTFFDLSKAIKNTVYGKH